MDEVERLRDEVAWLRQVVERLVDALGHGAATEQVSDIHGDGERRSPRTGQVPKDPVRRTRPLDPNYRDDKTPPGGYPPSMISPHSAASNISGPGRP